MIIKLLYKSTFHLSHFDYCVIYFEDDYNLRNSVDINSLGPLVNKVKEFQVETIVDTLCNNMISTKEQLRDISSIGKSL